MEVRVEVYNYVNLSEILKGEINTWIDNIFVANENPDDEWAIPSWYVLVLCGNMWVSSLGIYERVVQVDKQNVHVGGIGTVMTLPGHRGKGYARQGLIFATQFIYHQLKLDFGLLFCKPYAADYYKTLRWESLNEPVTFAHSTGQRLLSSYVPMAYACSGHTFPKGPIDLCGLPW